MVGEDGVFVIPWELSLGDCDIAVDATHAYTQNVGGNAPVAPAALLEMLIEFSKAKRLSVELLVDGRFTIIRQGKIDS